MPNTVSRKIVGLSATAIASPQEQAPGTLKPSRKVQAAIHAMVWHGLKRADAAASAGLKDHALYSAFRLSHVKSFYLRELEVLRTSALSRNFHLLERIAENADNDMAKVAAIRQMGRRDELTDQRGNIGAQTPGLTIQIVTEAPKPLVQIEQ